MEWMGWKRCFFILWRSVSVVVCSCSLTNKGEFHQKASSSCEAHTRCLFDVGFFWEKYKTGDSNDMARSRLQTLIEESILASGALSVGRALLEQVAVISLAPTGARKQVPHPSTTCPGRRMRVPRERLVPSQTPANAASYCCGTFINIVTELTGIRELYKAIIPLEALTELPRRSLATSTAVPFLMFSFDSVHAASPSFLAEMRSDRKINKENIVVWQWHETPKVMCVRKSASCQRSFGW